MVLIALGAGLRRSELFALKWKDIDFAAEHISVARSIVNQVVGTCKTEASQKPVPLHSALAHALLVWRRQTSYRKREDWAFASPHSQGSHPLWVQAVTLLMPARTSCSSESRPRYPPLDVRFGRELNVRVLARVSTN